MKIQEKMAWAKRPKTEILQPEEPFTNSNLHRFRPFIGVRNGKCSMSPHGFNIWTSLSEILIERENSGNTHWLLWALRLFQMWLECLSKGAKKVSNLRPGPAKNMKNGLNRLRCIFKILKVPKETWLSCWKRRTFGKYISTNICMHAKLAWLER